MKNQLMVFTKEMFSVKAQKVEGEILFDAESVALSLGLKRVAGSGNEVVRWDRVNKYLSSSCPQVGTIKKGTFIPEAAVYKLAFKANNELAEKFQDWLAIEVLPSIRKTGSYSVDQTPKHLQIEERPYQYIEKRYNGEVVLTLRDMENLSDPPFPHGMMFHYMRKANLTHGVDYWLLEGNELERFKRENGGICKGLSSLYVIAKSGYLKMAKYIPRKAGQGCYKEEKKEQPIENDYEGIQQKINALKVMVDTIRKYQRAGCVKDMKNASWMMAIAISEAINKIKI